MDKCGCFTKRKFQSFCNQKQHKKCAELLRHIYKNRVSQLEWEADWENYQQLLQWMSQPYVEDQTIEMISNLCYQHELSAGIQRREHHLLPQVAKGDREESAPRWPIAIYLDHLRSAHNVGSIIRTVEAFALGSVYFSTDTPFIDNKQVQNTSMGTYQWVESFQNQTLHTLPKPIIALETCPTAKTIYDFRFPATFTLVVGNEEYGCSEETLAMADVILNIPLRGRKNSLNVANAFALIAGEIVRQRIEQEEIL
jgi:tRNA G18 (ribose-2'-O)-methylase SpoU